MRLDRLSLAAACALIALPVAAQTSNTTTTSTSTTSTQGSAAGQMGANQTGEGAMSGQPSMNTTGASPTGGNMTGMSASGAMQGGAAGAATSGPFRQITPAAGADLVTVLQASGQFTTLLKAIKATNLLPVFNRPGNLTLFAPTDAAFAALPPSTLATLMKPANISQLQQLVLLHTVNTPITSKDLLNHSATNVATVATNKKVHLDGSSGTIKVDDATVLQSDVKASNGTIFVVDKVLSPDYTPAPAAPAAPAAAPSAQ